MSVSLKPVEWVGSSLEDLKGFPEDVRQAVGYALYLAQSGEKHPSAKPLKGFKGAGVLDVLHAFQKKSKQGIATPKPDIELIEARLKRAKEHYSQNYNEQQGE
jgi:phage-related protein